MSDYAAVKRAIDALEEARLFLEAEHSAESQLYERLPGEPPLPWVAPKYVSEQDKAKGLASDRLFALKDVAFHVSNVAGELKRFMEDALA